jgi:general secretion pathway protein D
MTRRLRPLWCGAALGLLTALSAVPGAPQDQNQNAQTPPQPRERPAGVVRPPRTRRGYTAGQQPRAGTPPLPAPAGAGQLGQPGPPAARAGGAPQDASSPTAPPTKLEVVQGRGGEKEVWMEVYDLDLDHLLRLLSSEAGVTITKTEAVKGKVTIIAPDPVPLDVAFQILDSILQMRGYAMIRDGCGIYKIMPMNEAAQSGLPVNFGANPEEVPDTAELITQVVQLRNLSANDAAQDISSLLSAGVGGGGPGQGGGAFTARVVPTTTNALIITDTAANVKRVLTIIADMEQQLSGGYQIFRLQYYDASTMADVINSLILSRGGGAAVPTGARRQPWEVRAAQGGRPGAPAPQRQPTPPTAAAGASVSGSEFVFPDTKTNSLVVQATPIHLQQISNLVDQLDRPVNLRDSFVVYPVQNLMASELAQRVGQHLGITVNVTQGGGTAGAGTSAGRSAAASRGASSATGRGRTSYRGGTSATPFGTGGTNVYRGLSVPGDASSGEAKSSLEVEPLAAPSTRVADPMEVAQAPEGAVAVPAAPPAPVASGPGAEIVAGDEGEVVSPTAGGGQAVITADDNTNTILVTGPPEQADLIQAMLEKLDVLPPQVYIQAIIAEVILSNDQNLGFEWSNLMATLNHNGEQFQGIFDTNFGLGARDDNGNLTRTIGTGLSGFITGPENFAALLTALAQSQNVRVLSTPSIFTSNNEPGNITVASGIPFPTTTLTSTTGTGTGVTPVIQTGVDYQNVGIVLDVTPRITQGDVVHLEVGVSANDVGDPIIVGGQSFPTTRDREAQATLSVKDGYTVVLGGLMRDSVSHSATKVPILGDIPLVGALFRSSHTHVDKSELLVFLTPHVVRSPADAARLTDEEKCKLQELPRSLQKPSAPVPVPVAPMPVQPAAPVR